MSRRRISLTVAIAFAAIVLVAIADVDAHDCTPEPASIWAPAGWVCPPAYGDGIASTWPGPGAARNDCTWPFDACTPIIVTSLETGRSITVVPVTWCHCWTRVTGPGGETARIVDLDPSQVAALGLDPQRGLWPVRVTPAGLPDTATDR